MRLTFARSNCVSSIAREFHCSRTYVRESVNAVADCTSLCWDHVLKKCLEIIERDRIKVCIFYDKLKTDDSDQTLSLDVLDFVSRDQRRAAWCINVQERWVGWTTEDGQHIEMGVPVPPTVVVGKKRICVVGRFS